jgi:hypothetical protein
MTTETVSVQGDLVGDVTGAGWMGWEWSPWVPATKLAAAPALGLYRLGAEGVSSQPVYIGQGKITHRISAHLSKAALVEHRQALHFFQPLEASWVRLEGMPVHLLEHENDLIASHVLNVRASPAAQFVG